MVKECVILIGAQATGESTFYRERFLRTHIRINLDMLRTRHREQRLVETCLEVGQSFVVDNTSPRRYDRNRYIGPANQHGFNVIGYYFQSTFADAIRRNAKRPEDERVPEAGVRGTHAMLEDPSLDEGFDALFYVTIDIKPGFVVEKWKNQVLTTR